MTLGGSTLRVVKVEAASLVSVPGGVGDDEAQVVGGALAEATEVGGDVGVRRVALTGFWFAGDRGGAGEAGFDVAALALN